MKTICKKSTPGNLSQVLNLTFDHCFKVKWIIIIKHPYTSLIIGVRASEYKNSQWKVLVCKCFAYEQFWPHFENQNDRNNQLFENHKNDLNLEILQLVSPNLHKKYMARKVSLIVILA